MITAYIISLIIGLISYRFYYLVRHNSYIFTDNWSPKSENLEKVKFPIWEAWLLFLLIFIPFGFIIILLATGYITYTIYDTDLVKFPKDDIFMKILRVINKDLNQ